MPSGSPNSSSVGIIRSNGLPFGTFATKTRAHAELRRCWRLLALALGRDDPFPAPLCGASQPALITSFDGILYTRASDNFTGLKPHTDTYPPPHGETGQLQALAYVHPPPPGVLRLGCAVAFYPAKAHSLWRDYLLALVTRWSTSPDLDLRKSPLPKLGSKQKAAGSIVSFWGARTYPKKTQQSFPTQSCKHKRSNCHQLFVASPKLLANTRQRNASRRSISSNGAPQPTAKRCQQTTVAAAPVLRQSQIQQE